MKEPRSRIECFTTFRAAAPAPRHAGIIPDTGGLFYGVPMGYTTDFLLLMTKDDGHLIADATRIDLGLAGATLCDLVGSGHLDLDKDGRVLVRSTAETGSQVLGEAYRRFAKRQGKKAGSTLPKVAKDLRDGVYTELQTQGAVIREDHKMLGIFPQHRWPVQDPARVEELRRMVFSALQQPDGVTAQVGGLVSLISATDTVKEVTRDFESSFSTKDLKKRAKSIAEGDLEGAAVRKAIQDVQVAVNAAVTAAVTTTVITSN